MSDPMTSAACDGCGFTACPVLGQPCCDQCSHDQQRPASAAGRGSLERALIESGHDPDEVRAFVAEAHARADEATPTATRWWLLECAHHGYGAPDLLMRVRCEVCAKFRRAP